MTTIPFNVEVLQRRAAELDELHTMLTAAALGRHLDEAMPDPASLDPLKLPEGVREPAERAIAAAEEAAEKSLDRALAIDVARLAIAAATETPDAMEYLVAALDEAEAPPRTLYVPDPLSIGEAISLVIFVSKLHFDFKFGHNHAGKEAVGDKVLGQLAEALSRIADACGRLLHERSAD